MPLLTLEEFPEAIPIPYRSTADPDGLDLNTLLVANPISTFYLRVRGHRLRGWGVHDGDLLLVDRSIDPSPGHLVVVAHGGRFLLRPLVRQAGQWQLQRLGPEEAHRQGQKRQEPQRLEGSPGNGSGRHQGAG